MKKLTMMACVVASSCGLAYGQVRVQVQPAQPVQRTERANEGALKQATPSQFAKATELIGTQVQSSDGQMIGTIKDLVINTETNEVAFVLLDGEQTASQGYMVLPWAIADYPAARVGNRPGPIRVHVSHERLRGAPYVTSNQYQTFHDHGWATKTRGYFRAEIGTRGRFDRGDRDDRRERFRDRREDARDRADDAAEETRDRAEDARENLEDAREDARENVRDRAENVRERANDARENARERANDARENVRERANDARENVRERVESNVSE